MDTSQQKQRPEPLILVKGSKVALGPILPEHKPSFVNAILDPESSLYGSGFYKVRPMEKINEVWDFVTKDGNSFAIYELTGMQYIGGGELRRVDGQHGTAEFGISIERTDLRGQGYGTEATQLILEYGFRYLSLHNIMLSTSSFNTRAIAAYKKAGFRETGRRREALLVDGKRYDVVHMDILRSEFNPETRYWYTIPPAPFSEEK